MATQEQCQVLDHKQVGPRYFKLTLKSHYISTNGEPGQFVNVRVDNGTEPLLRRPISLHRINKEHQTFELLYEVVGEGTTLLTKATIGSKVDVLGPLGSGFKLDPAKKIAILVGGGMGIAPLAALAEKLKTLGGRAVYALAGARDKSCLVCEDELASLANQSVVATDDGSQGRKGYVSDLLIDLLNNTVTQIHYPETAIYAC
ncbi:MAG: dihydroorotate dehydrogenase electron transfer subunit, partial [Candidatus Margulisbacteria bacterium]|nr:dihydroorotate dehydrogenase electron transfer subunit [Candidatus Margulisiibacteriota bacterium]